MDRRSAIAALATLTVASAFAGVAPGAPRLTPNDAATRARARFEGEVLDIDLDDAEDDEPGEEVYEVRLLTPGGVVVRVRIDANTGEFLGAAGDDIGSALRRPDAASGGANGRTK